MTAGGKVRRHLLAHLSEETVNLLWKAVVNVVRVIRAVRVVRAVRVMRVERVVSLLGR